ncbi:MAG: 2Fe-2S iron-sulfur cluster-binding protein [Chloroflexi bacterium]|nr:2Fe-2S iron-sulfur cluster-binding protein [Chloroflexota bacterium]
MNIQQEKILNGGITLTIDDQEVTVPPGTTILSAAGALGTVIPTICYHDHLTAYGICRLCVVEVEQARVLQPACVAEAREGMTVHTRNTRVERSRRTILEMLDSAVNLEEAPEIQAQLDDYGANRERFENGERRSLPIIDDNPMFLRDYSQCVLCWRCVQVCADDAQYTYAINFSGRGFETSIDTFFEQSLPESTCVFCGQCVDVCPTGALKPKREWLLEQGQTPDEIMQMTRMERRRRKT